MAYRGKKEISDLVAEVFKRGGIKRAVKRANIVLLWPQVVGSAVAKFTTAKVFRDGVLYIDVSDSETSMHLMLQRQKFIDVYRTKYRVRELRDISFKVGRVVEQKAKVELPVSKIDQQELKNMAKELSKLNLPDKVAKPAMLTAKSLLALKAKRRAQGWKKCLICDGLSPKEQALCSTCERYSEQKKVLTAAKKLMEQPALDTPWLSQAERNVAVYLAKNMLEERMQELLPLVLIEPKHKPELERRAKCFLAHKLNKSVSRLNDFDFDLLDHRVTRALGRWN